MITTKRFVFRFSDIEIHEHELRATRGGQALDLEPKAFRLLVYLIKHAGHLVSKSELIDAVWGETAVTDNSLTRNIALLRRVLEDDPRQPRFIETVSTAGYRFICPVETGENASPDLSQAGSPDSTYRTNATAESLAGDARISTTIEEKIPAFSDSRASVVVDTPASHARTSKRVRFGSIALIAVMLVAAVVSLEVEHRNRAIPLRISEYKKLTQDGHAGWVIGTDGSRLYLQSFIPNSISQVSASGGEIAPVPLITFPSPLLVDVSPDGSTLLVRSAKPGSSLLPLYTLQVVGGSHRYLADGTADAAWSPDGKLVAYTTANGDMNIINSDGTGAHKLASVGGRATSISWSPDGRRIRFRKHNALWEITSAGNNIHPLLAGITALVTGWQPDRVRGSVSRGHARVDRPHCGWQTAEASTG